MGPRPSGPVWPILRRLFGYMRPYTKALVGVIAVMLATTLIGLVPPWLIRYSVDRFILTGEYRRVWGVAAILLGISLAQGGIDFLRLYVMAYIGQKIVFGIRSAIFEHLSQLSFSFYDKARTGDLMSRVTADVDVLSDFFGRAAPIVITNFLTLIGILVVLLIWNLKLGLLYLFFLPLIVHGMLVYAKRLRPALGMVRRRLAGLTEALQESLVGILVIKLFGRETFEEKKVDRQSKGFLQISIETTKIAALWMPYVYVVMGVSMALVLWFGGRGVIQGAISLGTLIGFTTYISMLVRPIRQTGMMLSVLMRSVAAAERVFAMLDIQPEIRDAPDAYPLPKVTGHVRFEGVSFAYDGVHNVLQDIYLEAKPGEMA